MSKKDIKFLIKFTIIAITVCYIVTEIMHDYYIEQYLLTLKSK